VNLAGVALESVQRGAWLMDRAIAQPRDFALRLEVLADFPRAVRHWTPVHAYHATTHTTARVALLTPGALEPGTTAIVELVTDTPLAARYGDHVVLRDQSLDRTLGGGRLVTDLQPATRRRRSSGRLARIDAFAASSDVADAFARLLAVGPFERTAFQDSVALSDSATAALIDASDVIEVDGCLVPTTLWTQWQDAIVTFTRAHLDAHPAAPGVRANEYRLDSPARFRMALFSALVANKRLAITAGAFHPPGHAQRLDLDDQRLLDRVTPLLDAEQPPSAGDLAKILRLPLARLESDLRRLVAHRAIVQVADKRYYLPHRLAPLARCAAELGARGPFSAREFRDAAGVGRNVAIDVLEYFDRRGYTRRSGDVRTVVGMSPI
jgi:selenocysteine-specific elongation factor